MPFQSKAQMKALFAKNPKVAHEFAAHMTKAQIKALPAKKGRQVKKGSK